LLTVFPRSANRSSKTVAIYNPATRKLIDCRTRRAEGDLPDDLRDAEPHEPLLPDVVGAIALDEELAGLAELTAVDSAVCWDRVLFSAKGTVYKAWFLLTHRWLTSNGLVITTIACC
jgi:hypothetical protein